MHQIAIFMTAFIVTIVSEGLITVLWEMKWRFFICSLLCNLLTNPLLNVALAVMFRLAGVTWFYIALFSLEIVVILVEAAVYRLVLGIKPDNAFAMSLAANCTSFLLGFCMGF